MEHESKYRTVINFDLTFLFSGGSKCEEITVQRLGFTNAVNPKVSYKLILVYQS